MEKLLYRYESAEGQFVANLRINEDLYMVDYPNMWQAESGD